MSYKLFKRCWVFVSKLKKSKSKFKNLQNKHCPNYDMIQQKLRKSNIIYYKTKNLRYVFYVVIG